MRDQKATWTPVEEKPREGDMVKVQLATPETAGGEMPEGSPYNLVLGGGQAIPGVEELDHGAHAGRDEGARREVAG